MNNNVNDGVRMKNVTAFVGSARKKSTYNAVLQFLQNLEQHGEVEYEIVLLSDYHLETCKGCKVCFEKGEESCPLDDDLLKLVEKMNLSDGVVFATPNYSFHVSGQMKVFLDRLGFIFHRPRFFGKVFTSIVTQGIYGGGKIVKYLDFVGNGMGFNVVKGYCFTALEPMTDKERMKRDTALLKLSQSYYNILKKPHYPTPSLFDLMAFRMGRTSIRLELDDTSQDYSYYAQKGWFESEYYYPTRLGIVKKAAGSFFDGFQSRMTKKR
jgi:multimeric flavodoxin WrbA